MHTASLLGQLNFTPKALLEVLWTWNFQPPEVTKLKLYLRSSTQWSPGNSCRNSRPGKCCPVSVALWNGGASFHDPFNLASLMPAESLTYELCCALGLEPDPGPQLHWLFSGDPLETSFWADASEKDSFNGGLCDRSYGSVTVQKSFHFRKWSFWWLWSSLCTHFLSQIQDTRFCGFFLVVLSPVTVTFKATSLIILYLFMLFTKTNF